MKFLQMKHLSFVVIALRNLSYSAFSKRSTERLFLVTHYLSALHKGPLQQSKTLLLDEGPNGPCLSSKDIVSVFIFFNIGGWIFLAKMHFVNYNSCRIKLHFSSGRIRYCFI
jgi:hypothetical protein